MDIEFTLNTDDEVIASNTYLNSRRNLKWVSRMPEHDGHAVLVGGGPSIKKDLEEIKWRASQGQKIFALNNAAKYLSEHGITADYLVMVDARAFNARFIGYANHYLLASQCDPSVFDAAGDNVTLWHAADDDLDRVERNLPEDSTQDFAMITGGFTVGLSAMTLVYAMGYRFMHLYGYDSSHEDNKRHAYPQDENNVIAECKVTVFGKTFQSSIAMAHQAEIFPQLCDILIDNGCTITVHGEGLIPHIVREMPNQPKMSEEEKYKAMWSIDAYREKSPGEACADLFTKIANITDRNTVFDLGCGSGRGGKRIKETTNANVIQFDFVENCRDNGIDLPFIKADLTSKDGIKTRYDDPIGFCTDVLEHIPTEDVDTVLKNITQCTSKAFLQISLVHDGFGQLIGQTLHLTVKPFQWWREKLEKLGKIEYSQDLSHTAIFYISTT